MKEDIELQAKNLRNPNTQKQFKDYYFDKDKTKSVAKTTSTTGTK
jgi:hypothetical protein